MAQEYLSTQLMFSYSITHVPLENLLMLQHSTLSPCPPRVVTPHLIPTHVANYSCFLLYDVLACKIELLRAFLGLELTFAYSSRLSSPGQYKLSVISIFAFLVRHFSKFFVVAPHIIIGFN